MTGTPKGLNVVRILSILILLSMQAHFAAAQTEADLQLQQAQDLYGHGKIKESLGILENALSGFTQANNIKGIADASYQLGRVYRRLGKLMESARILNEAMKLHESLNDEVSRGMDLIELGTTLQRQGTYAEALTASESGLAIQEKYGNKAGIAKALDIIGAIYHRRAEYDKALDFLGRALSVATEAGDKRVLSGIYADFGSVYWVLGDFDRALDSYDKEQKLIEEIGDPSDLSSVIGNRALVHWNQGDLKSALQEFDQCGVLFREIGNKQGEAVNYYNIGLLQMNLGNYTKAEEALQQSLAMAKEVGDKGLAGVAYEGLGTLNRDLGNYDAALDYMQSSLKTSQEIGETRAVAYALMGIGKIEEGRENYAAALQQYRKGFELFQKENEKKAIAWSLQQLGRIHSKMGDRQRALANFQSALAIQEAIGNKPGMGGSNMLIGEIYYQEKRMAEADAALAKAVDILRQSDQPDLLWRALYRKGLVYRDTGKTAEAVQRLKEAVDVIEKMREDVQLAEQKSGFLEDKLDAYDDLIELLAKTGEVGEAFEYLERSKARAFLDLLSEARIDPQSTVSPDLYRKKKILLAELMRANKKIGEEYEKEKNDAATIQKLEMKRSRSEEEYVNLLFDIRKQNPRYAVLQYPQPSTLSDAQQLIGENDVLIDYHLGRTGSLAFVITRNDAQVFPLPGNQRLSSQVQALLESIQKPEPAWEASGGFHTKFVNVAGLLYTELLKPAEKLAGKRRIVIVPAGVLNYLPFESLLEHQVSGPIHFEKLPYFALDHQIQYVPSVSVLAAVRKNAERDPSEHRKALIAFADPALGAAAGAHGSSLRDAAPGAASASLPDLPYARIEVEEISKLYPGDEVRVLLGKDASEANAKSQDMAHYRIVHFASHGLIDAERPELSALVLTPGPGDEEDGFLTMREVFDLRLNADLVVLSACKTGLGRQVRGEGMDGLARAFLFAGTSRVLVSLWDVYDPSTAEFMTTFYRNLKDNGMAEAEALQQARLNMIHSQKYSHPYYWAPFVLIGRN